MPTRKVSRTRARTKLPPASGSRFFARLLSGLTPDDRDDLVAGPIRGELLGADQLAERARALAKRQRSVVRRTRRPARLLSRLQGTERILGEAHERLRTVAEGGFDVGPAGDWLLDNYHVVQEHINEVTASLPRGYYRELPELSRGTLTGYPRVYELAISLISHTEGRIDLENVDAFVGAYQEVAQLSLGELWAIPAMLRLGLLESVRRMALRSVQWLDEVQVADRWASRIQGANALGSLALGEVLREFVATPHALTPVFVSRFLTQLRLAAGPFPPLVWLESWISDEGLSAEEASARSTQRMALTQLMMANSITSLRAIARRDWRSFVEHQSIVEQVLRDDPAGCYALQTFATRDQYRHVIERIAKRRRLSEGEVARIAIDLARDGMNRATDDRREGHVGYYLIDRGLAELEEATDYIPSLGERVGRWVHRHPNTVFFGGVVAITAAALLALLWLGGASARTSWLVVLVALLPANDIAINILNQLLTAVLHPRRLPKLDLQEHGIPADARTVVVVPTLFPNVEAVHDALEHLEVQFLANREHNLHFAILSDFTDAANEHAEGDEEILAAAIQGIDALNTRYCSDSPEAFSLFHRSRLWNPVQGVWMGWERKRGKLAAFNQFIRGGAPNAFSTVTGDVSRLREVRYVITLDSDTVLPPDAATALVGTIAHPLNVAQYDDERGLVVRGYGIIQPRVGVSLPSAHRSRFAAIHSGHPGVDPYTTAVSDVYQDLYGEGSFTGKGIYDVDAFELATHGRFPENTLLSHDLIEGNYARAGLATDIVVYDEYPSRYLTYTRRKHRWIRGDWQLLRWLTSRVPGPEGDEPNRLTPLSRWKILDNLRRSLVEVAQLVFLLAAWTILPGSPLKWTLLGLGAIAAPWIVALLIAVSRPPLDKSWRAYYATVGEDAVTSALQLGQALAFLPHQAFISLDAIVRTLYRIFVSRRYLLEWQTASQTERSVGGSSRDIWRTMWPAVAIPLVMIVAIALSVAWKHSLFPGGTPAFTAITPNERARLIALALSITPFALVWSTSPILARALSRAEQPDERRLEHAQREVALRYALLHWRFFERFVDESTNWLAPDNYQDDPAPAVAMRTSPTNIGLQLLSTVSAFELGFISLGDMTDRLERAFRSMERMARYRGHFFNWYDLAELRVLEPAYISTVDSGNLAGHLIALRQACLAIANEHESASRVWRALDSSLALASQQLDSAERFGVSTTTTQAASELRVARAAVGALSRRSTRNKKGASPGVSDSSDPTAYESAIVASLERARGILSAAGVAPATPARTVASLGAESERATIGVTGSPGRRVEDEEASPRAAVRRAAAWIDWSLARLARLQSDFAWSTNGTAPRANETPLPERAGSAPNVETLQKRLQTIADRSHEMAMAMDFRFLYDAGRELFAIGYQTSSHSLDASSYDLLASEARLASFIAIAKDDVPVDHWFRLGRTLTSESGATALISWSGSMFEYLMPVLVMQSFPSTLLDQTYQAVVRRQMAYGGARGVPWGVSESAYNLRDRHFTYQYRAFGVPDLALKRGLGRDLVIAPYASLLAAMVDLPAATENLSALERAGALGSYGFRDALDYTRPSPGERYAIVQNYMAHHVGMSMVALANVLLHRVWQRRFHADPLVQSAELLLHERVPRRLVLQEPQEVNPDEALPDPAMERSAVREIDDPNTSQPQIALLGYLPYTVMISHCGSGYSRYEELAVTRWRSDGTRDDTGQFCYVRDVSSGRSWSTSYQPTCARADWYRAYLATDRVTFHRADGDIETRTDIAIVPEDAAEVRRVTMTNNGNTAREIELTSYGEIVLGAVDADRAHPAFANLFVETEWHEWCTAITATRRPRSSDESPVHLVHVVDVAREQVGTVSYETDRAHFIGRGNTARAPRALTHAGALDGTIGAVLDPIFALRVRVALEPGRSSSVTFTTLVAPTRERAFELAGRYHDPHAGQRALDLTWTATQIELRELNVTPAEAAVFQEIAGHLLYSDPTLRANQETLRRNTGSQPQLWSNGISGDWPILLATIDSADGLPTLRQLFAAHRYWRRRGLTIDLVVINDSAHTYLQDLNDRITETMFSSSDSAVIDRPGGVFLRRKSILDPNDLLMLEATARVHVRCDGRSLARIIDSAHAMDGGSADDRELLTPVLRPSGRSTPPSLDLVQRVRAREGSDAEGESASHGGSAVRTETPTTPTTPRGSKAMVKPRLFENGYGGLLPNGDYEITVRAGDRPPAPWTNVIANAHGGFLVSEGGSGATWAENSYFYRLTPWRNDPVSDVPSDVIYLRDERTGDVWSATPAPIHDGAPFTVRHAAGGTTFTHERNDIASHLTMGLAPDAAVKLSTLQLTNHDSRPRRISVTAYAEWTLGVLREHTQHQVQTFFDAGRSTLFAWNHFDPQFSNWVAFAAMSESVRAFTSDRSEFLGRNGTLSAPAALSAATLSGRVGAAIDPCAALQCVIDLAPGERRDVVIILGAAPNEDRAAALVERYRSSDEAADATGETMAAWQRRLEVVAVHTPEPSFDAMVNRWTLYQALACRMWARSALYQSSGAYGFRDQLQDVMAFVYAEPEVAREHIVRAASRQFLEGDVQHWWHPQSGRGVRTRFSDDLAWLPFVVEHYVRITGDTSVLDDYVPFLSMRPLAPDEHEVYELPAVTEEHGSIYEHCLRALRKACTVGPHELPLIGTGDWNDGMNRVGVLGKGESVWLAWFLVATLRRFAPIAESRGDNNVAADLSAKADAYVAAIEASAWDGGWYRRAYFDDGTPLGSSQSDECRIDSIAQSWSVISGAGDDDRQREALASLEQHLVREDAQLIMLLTPPFDKTPNDPGYIKGYLPGVRENGAQYTHAALWAVLATALRGDGDRAFALYQMLNPLMHSNTRQEVETYKVEPYVVAADVYTAQGQLGRGGWTWYTGSASWMYRVALEHILGFTKRGDRLSMAPCIPASWQGFAIDYRFGKAVYAIVVENPENVTRGIVRVSVDGHLSDSQEIVLVDDGARHEVIVMMGRTHDDERSG